MMGRGEINNYKPYAIVIVSNLCLYAKPITLF